MALDEIFSKPFTRTKAERRSSEGALTDLHSIPNTPILTLRFQLVRRDDCYTCYSFISALLNILLT
jgi:hypothetical protein